MAGTGKETERKDDGGLASWLGAPSYAPDAAENAELPWTLKAPVAPPSDEPQSEHDFVVVPREGDGPASSSRGELKKRSIDPDNWSVRESEHKHDPIVIPINEALIPKPPPPPAMRRAALALLARWDRATPRQRIGVTTAAVAIVGGMFVGLMLSSIFRPGPAPPAFPGKTYHVPQVLAGVGAAPALSAQASALQGGLTTLAPSAHTEVADYSDAAGNIDYELALVQDNLGHSTLRFDADLASQFPNYESQTEVDKTTGGITISCATILARSSAYQGCTWYNSFAFGAFIDNVSATPSQAMSTLGPVLQHMASLTTTRGVNAS